MGIDVPEAYGGAGGTFFQSILAVEEISRADAAVGVLVDVQNTLFNNAILAHGATKPQKAAYLPRAASDTVAAYALSEAGSGSDAFALSCGAERIGGDSVVLDGHKLWITNAAEAGVFLVFANVDPAKGYKGITAFLLEREDPGFPVGKREHKLGIRASSTCELLLRRLPHPAPTACWARSASGYKIAIETLNEGRIGIGAQMLGVAARRSRRRLGLRQGARAVRQDASPSSRPCSTSWPSARRASRPRACSSTTRRGCATPGRPFIKRGGHGQARTPARRPSSSPPRRSRSSAATATPPSTRSRSSTATPRSARSTRGRPSCSSPRSPSCSSGGVVAGARPVPARLPAASPSSARRSG